MQLSLLASLSVALASLTPAEAFSLVPRAKNDPFYNAPGFVRKLPNGAIVRTRKLDHATFNLSAPIAAAYQLLYKTSDPVSLQDIVTPATVVIPPKALQSAKRNILSYQAAYDSADAACGPSQASASAPQSDPTKGSGIYVELALNQSLITLIPDYEGPEAAFTAGQLSGQGVVDAIRAVLDFKPAVPNKLQAQVVLEGFSGGALATGWATQVQPVYAPELTPFLKGAAFGGLPRNATRDLLLLDGTAQSGLIVNSISGIAAEFPDFSKFLNKHLNKRGRQAISYARSHCLSDVALRYANTSFYPNFTDLTTAQALASPVVQRTMEKGVLASPGSPVPVVPIFCYHGDADTTVPFQDTVDYYNAQCARGIKSLTRLDVHGLNHTGTAEAIEPRQARAFLLQRLAGQPAPVGCSQSVYTPPSTSPTARASNHRDDADEQQLTRRARDAYSYGLGW